jgi:hypothetical protein
MATFEAVGDQLEPCLHLGAVMTAAKVLHVYARP